MAHEKAPGSEGYSGKGGSGKQLWNSSYKINQKCLEWIWLRSCGGFGATGFDGALVVVVSVRLQPAAEDEVVSFGSRLNGLLALDG